MTLYEEFKIYEDELREKEVQQELSLHPITLEPWELRPLAIPGFFIGIFLGIILPDNFTLIFFVIISLITLYIISKYHQLFTVVFSSFTVILLFIYSLIHLSLTILDPSFGILANILLLSCSGSICSLTILSVTQGMSGEHLRERRKLEIKKDYEIKYFAYKSFRLFWDKTLNSLVSKLSQETSDKTKITQLYFMIQELEKLNDKRSFLQKDLNLNLSLILTEDLPLTEHDINSKDDFDKVRFLEIELDIKIEKILLDIENLKSLT
ncbi:MAG: hypothetical protein COB02_16685 [Candidatus Cloacimonadota bacterium]|nr:MAG: hypothetical protein COB02_16685 [Candidatus Cloacimonadota bacterium]